MALNGLFCADVPLRNYSLTNSFAACRPTLKSHTFASAHHVYSHPHASVSDSTFDYWRYINNVIQ